MFNLDDYSHSDHPLIVAARQRKEQRVMFANSGIPEQKPLPAHGRPPIFGDPDQGRAYRESFQRQQETQLHEFVVAPMCHVDLGARRFKAGEPISPSDGVAYGDLSRLATARVVTRVPEEDLRQRGVYPSTWEYVHTRPVQRDSENFSIAHWPHEEAKPEHFALSSRPAIAEVPDRYDSRGIFVPGTTARPAREASDGAKEFEAALADGRVIRNPRYQPPATEPTRGAKRA